MSNPTTEITAQYPIDDDQFWELHAPPTDLIFDDGELMESNRHRTEMNLLIDSFAAAWSDRDNFYVGGNMFVYYSYTQAKNQDFKGPDFFVVLDVDGTRERQGWVVWEEEGRYPDVIIELLSPSTTRQDLGPKKEIYERIFKTSNYFVFDPFNDNLFQGWRLNDGQYQSLVPDERGWLWCESLGFWLGTWEGTFKNQTTVWLRFYNREGNLILHPDETAQQAQQEAQQAQQEAQQAQQEAQQERFRAERLAAKLREMGVDPDSM